VAFPALTTGAARRCPIVPAPLAKIALCVGVWDRIMDALAAGHDAARSSNVGVLRLDLTRSWQTIWRPSNSPQSKFGCVRISLRPNLARQKNGDIAGTACCSLPMLLSWRSIALNDLTYRTSRHHRSHLSFLRPEIAKRHLLRLARKRNLATWLRQNNPTGKSPKTLSSPLAKNISLNMEAKSPAYLVGLTR
jgi:hypothetical protein